MTKVIVAALYHFTKFSDYKKLQDPLRKICNSEGIKGSLLIAYEGINGTISGSRSGIDAVLKHIRSMPGCSNLEHKESFASEIPFKRMKVKLKKEIENLSKAIRALSNQLEKSNIIKEVMEKIDSMNNKRQFLLDDIAVLDKKIEEEEQY